MEPQQKWEPMEMVLAFSCPQRFDTHGKWTLLYAHQETKWANRT